MEKQDNLWDTAQLELINSKIGDNWGKIEVIKRTPKKIHLSNGLIVSIKNSKFGFIYLSSSSFVKNNKSYNKIDQILRDIEGFLLYKIHSQ